MFDLAAKAVAAGYRISRPELEEATGYALEGLQTPSEGGLPPFAGVRPPDMPISALQSRCKTLGALRTGKSHPGGADASTGRFRA